VAGTVSVTDPRRQTTYDAFGHDYQARRFCGLYEICAIMAAYHVLLARRWSSSRFDCRRER